MHGIDWAILGLGVLAVLCFAIAGTLAGAW
jgi:hypothetical protein